MRSRFQVELALLLSLTASACEAQNDRSDSGAMDVDLRCDSTLLPFDVATRRSDLMDASDDSDATVDDAHGEALADAADEDHSAPCICGPSSTPCERTNAHIDCGGGFGCFDNIPYAGFQLPIYYCPEQITQDLLRRVCFWPLPAMFGDPPNISCVGQCSAARRDPRYSRCDARGLSGFPSPFAKLARQLCSALPCEGSPCQFESDCHPAADIADINLRCVARRCVRAPRPEAPAGFGVDCSVTRYFRCLVDEDCPAGWDCSLDDRCSGLCVPRAARRDRNHPSVLCR